MKFQINECKDIAIQGSGDLKLAAQQTPCDHNGNPCKAFLSINIDMLIINVYVIPKLISKLVMKNKNKL